MYQPILKAKNQRQHGSLLFNCLIWLLILGIFMWAILTFSTIAMRKVGERKDAVVLSTVSQNAAPKDLESAVFVYLDFLPLQFQAYFSKQFGKFGPTLDAIDQLCKQKFPLYDQLELRGATLARNSAFANLQSDINKIYGNATIMIQYDGVYHTETIPGNTLDPSEYPYTIALTCTVPYKLAKFRTDIPEDGDGTNRLGSAWRPVRAVSTWTGTKGGSGTPDEPPPTPDPSSQPQQAHVPTFEAATEVRMLIAFALPQDGEIPVDTPGIIGDPSTGGCDPNSPVSVILFGDGTCRVGNCAFTAATNFPDCRDSGDNKSNPYTFANDWNNGKVTREAGNNWRNVGVTLLIQGDRIGTLKAPRDKFGDMMIAQIPQTLIPTGNSLLKTKVKYTEFRPIMPGRYSN